VEAVNYVPDPGHQVRQWAKLAAELATHIVLDHGLPEYEFGRMAQAADQDDKEPAHLLQWLQILHEKMTGYPACQDQD
jgi:hypothetical protein